MNKPALSIFVLAFFGVFLSRCDSTADEQDSVLSASILRDIPADPTTGRDPTTGAPISTRRYTLINLREGRIVLRYDNSTRTDSASTAWDIGFQGTNIILNGGSSGPGQGAAVLVSDLFENVTEAPADTDFRIDGQADCPSVQGQSGPRRAVCPGSDNGWYHYDAATNVIAPIPGRVLVVRTADGRFAKVRILSYYQGNPTTVDPQTAIERHYTIEYVFRENGSRNLASE